MYVRWFKLRNHPVYVRRFKLKQHPVYVGWFKLRQHPVYAGWFKRRQHPGRGEARWKVGGWGWGGLWGAREDSTTSGVDCRDISVTQCTYNLTIMSRFSVWIDIATRRRRGRRRRRIQTVEIKKLCILPFHVKKKQQKACRRAFEAEEWSVWEFAGNFSAVEKGQKRRDSPLKHTHTHIHI